MKKTSLARVLRETIDLPIGSAWVAFLRRTELLIAAMALAMLAACGGDGHGSGGTEPMIEVGPCEFTLPSGQDPENVTCGYLIVPENRRKRNGPTVRLAFVVHRDCGAGRCFDDVLGCLER